MIGNDPESKLDTYAELAIKVGLNVQPGQRMFVSAPLESAPFVRLAAKHAYLCGARLVEVLWSDDELTRVRFQYAPRDSFDIVPDGLVHAANEHAARRDAYLSILGQDPDLFAAQDPKLVAQYRKALAARMKPSSESGMRDAFNWLVVSAATPGWAARVLPGLPPPEQTAKLWDAIFAACRVLEPDPTGAWQAHVRVLAARCEILNRRRYAALHFFAPGTDLTVGLAEDHVWVGGATSSEKGILFLGNMPTEEVFTLPHRERTEGTVTSSLPLSVGGRVIEKFTLTFEQGRVTQAAASNDQAVLDELVGTDDGARRLGEVALVAASNPIARTGMLFYNGLFDENAASHIALGKGYPTTLRGGGAMSERELQAHGANSSLMHLDFMIGSAAMNVDGIGGNGAREPVMRLGEWAFGA